MACPYLKDFDDYLGWQSTKVVSNEDDFLIARDCWCECIFGDWKCGNAILTQKFSIDLEHETGRVLPSSIDSRVLHVRRG